MNLTSVTRIGFVLALVALAGCGGGRTSSTAKPGSEVGNLAADFNLKGVDGEPVSLSGLSGKVVVLDFWATWCGPCEREVPGFVALQTKYKDKGVVFVGLSIDDDESPIGPFMQRYRMNYPVALVQDRSLLRSYRVDQGIPTTFVIDGDGVIRLRHVGYTTPDTFEKAIQAAL